MAVASGAGADVGPVATTPMRVLVVKCGFGGVRGWPGGVVGGAAGLGLFCCGGWFGRGCGVWGPGWFKGGRSGLANTHPAAASWLAACHDRVSGGRAAQSAL